jgi:hypothetical protein
MKYERLTPTVHSLLYQPDNSLQLEVKLENETVWLTQAQMVRMYVTVFETHFALKTGIFSKNRT